MLVIVAVLVGLMPIVPAVIYSLRQKRTNPSEATRTLVYGLNGFNVLLGLMATGAGMVWLFSPTTAMAAGLQQAAAADPYARLAAALSTGLACVGAGIAVAGSGAAAVGATAEKPESFGRSLIFVGLSEGIAIYGLLISFLVLPR
ncbi:MAG TPA: ATP synthase subunit C [Anaerolineales bacterium]|nr:ATP synthase subunit C [Anaerolineales bacterium]